MYFPPFFFYNTPLPTPPLPFPVAASVSVVPISLFVTPRTTPRCVAVSVRTCVCVCVAAKGKGGELPVDNRLLATGDDNVPAAQERGLPSPVCFPLLPRSRFFSSALLLPLYPLPFGSSPALRTLEVVQRTSKLRHGQLKSRQTRSPLPSPSPSFRPDLNEAEDVVAPSVSSWK